MIGVAVRILPHFGKFVTKIDQVVIRQHERLVVQDALDRFDDLIAFLPAACARPHMQRENVLLPIPRHAFFKQTVLQGEFGNNLLQGGCLTAQIPNVVRGCSRAVSPASRFFPASRNSFDQR